MTDKDIGWLIIILLKENDFDFENYKILLKEYNLIELFKIYINLLSKIKDKNAHMHSQVKIINDNNFIVDIFINIDSEDITKLNKKLETVVPKSNISKKMIRK